MVGCGNTWNSCTRSGWFDVNWHLEIDPLLCRGRRLMIWTQTIESLPLDKPNHNGRIYKTQAVDIAIAEYMDKSDKLGMFDQPVHSSLDLSKVSHEVLNITIIEDAVLLTIKTLDTPLGKQLRDVLLSDGVDFHMNSIGYVDENSVVYDIENILSINAHTKEE